jgi:ankyrin repeat protein/Tfp pilus assembly protein PilF
MKKLNPVLVLVLLFAILPASTFAQDATRLISEADAAYTRADYKVAIEKLSAALPLMPARASEIREALAECYLMRGNVLFSKGDYKAALADYLKGLEYGPDWDVFYYNRGLCKYNLGDFDGALPDFAEALRMNAADNLAAYEYRGNSFYAKREYDKAIAEFSTGIEREPGKYILWVGRGESKYKLKDYTAALADLDKAVELNPKSTAARLVRARIKSARNDTSGAIADYSEAIVQKPGHADALRERAKLRHDQSDYEGEATDYLALFSAMPDEKPKFLLAAYTACINAGNGRKSKGEFREADAHYSAALELKPGTILALELRAEARAKAGDHGGAIEDYLAVLASSPGESKRLNPLLSTQYEERGSDSSAGSDYKAAAADYSKAAGLREGGLDALHIAAIRGDAKLLSAILKSGAAPNAKDADGATALMHAVNTGSLDAVKALVSGKADPKMDGILWVDRKEKQYYGSVLCAAAGSNAASLELLRYLVEELKLDVNQGSLIAGNPGRSELVPAFWASARGNYEKLEYLLKKGANPSASMEGTSLLKLSLTGANKDERFPTILLDKKAVVDKSDAALLSGAASKGFQKVLKRLLDAGIPASTRLPDGSFALLFAANAGQVEAAELLLKRGADINATMSNGATALHFAAQMGHAEVVQLLISNKATLGGKAKFQQGGREYSLTALELAQAAGQARIVEILKEAGAK